MKKLLKLSVFCLLIVSCSTGNHADFEKNTATAKKYFELHESEDADAMFELLHSDLEWHMPVYGSEMANAYDLKEAIVNYQKEFDNMKFTADYWLPGVDPETGKLDGSTRTYGTWTADHVASGKSVKLTAYHAFSFVDGKISGGGDWFDVGGMMNSLQLEQEADTSDMENEE
jgi:ketosteroid isomerase-like protein